MSDRTQANDAGGLNAPMPVSLAEALRALPPLAPPADAWAEMARKLRDSGLATRDSGEGTSVSLAALRSNGIRHLWPLGIAAALVLAFSAVAVLRMQHLQRTRELGHAETAQVVATESGAAASSVHNAANSTNSHDASSAATSLAALQSRSRALERWLRDTGAASAPQSTQDLAASAEIEDMIGLVDVQLGAADPADADTALPLWRRRVALLEDLSTLRYSANALSMRSGIAVNDAAAKRMDAAPTVWRN
ncbi:MAG: hypothetical protein JSS59_02590 [Proteobacteria bacterium]|uniref:hypothetical protein n=1 Tax=Rudaea sp. TaxID=2136325 RepID=UPI003784CF99|nr:hypothetical protein [Pseudomonadota bacterium]